MESSAEVQGTRSASHRAAARLAATLAAAALAAGSTGCATSDSDIPWNAPQSWEGSPTIPGFNQQ